MDVCALIGLTIKYGAAVDIKPVKGTSPNPSFHLSKKFVGVGLGRVVMECERGLITDGHFSGLAGPNQKPGEAYIISA